MIPLSLAYGIGGAVFFCVVLQFYIQEAKYNLAKWRGWTVTLFATGLYGVFWPLVAAFLMMVVAIFAVLALCRAMLRRVK